VFEPVACIELQRKLNATKKTVSQLASMVTALVEATANADYDREAIAKHLDFSLVGLAY
jgi:hypothetical protein